MLSNRDRGFLARSWLVVPREGDGMKTFKFTEDVLASINMDWQTFQALSDDHCLRLVVSNVLSISITVAEIENEAKESERTLQRLVSNLEAWLVALDAFKQKSKEGKETE